MFENARTQIVDGRCGMRKKQGVARFDPMRSAEEECGEREKMRVAREPPPDDYSPLISSSVLRIPLPQSAVGRLSPLAPAVRAARPRRRTGTSPSLSPHGRQPECPAAAPPPRAAP